ncbi:hypothetical protein LDP97_10435 [Aeromonas hydrophila]|uniref:hypothetical protein n=1 Tax=Aeromonas hydrophila TaxID=644 RepID=UPI00207AD71C|nr:hypothetical protein [Aeromonas hydrophila]USJ79426.1 hypothetical protein LDP97_10435 [Aeromonas hydrophila]
MIDNHYHFVFMILIRLHFLMRASVSMQANVCACRVLGGQTGDERGDETGEGGNEPAWSFSGHAQLQAAIKNPLQERVFKGHEAAIRGRDRSGSARSSPGS